MLLPVERKQPKAGRINISSRCQRFQSTVFDSLDARPTVVGVCGIGDSARAGQSGRD